MQLLEVSGAVRHIYIYIYIYVCVISQLKVKKEWTSPPKPLYAFMSCHKFSFIISRSVFSFILRSLYPRVESPQRPSNRSLDGPHCQLEVLEKRNICIPTGNRTMIFSVFQRIDCLQY